MRILYLSAHFPPDGGALARRVYDLSRLWVRRGHQVHVLCGVPCHPTGVIPPRYRRVLVARECVDGVRVHRTVLLPAANQGTGRRSLSYLSFAASTASLGQLTVPTPDVIVASSPHLLTAFSGALIARMRAVPLVVEVRDLWPRSIWEVGAMPRHHPVIALLERGERWLYRTAQHVVVVTQSSVAHVQQVAPGQQVSVIPNGVDLDLFTGEADGGALRQQWGLPADRIVALYAGTHGLAHGLETVLEAADRVPEVEFVLVGEGARKRSIEQAALQRHNVLCLPQQEAARMPAVLALADVVLVPLRDRPLFRTVIPSKLFEIWAMQRPVVLGVRGEAAELVQRAGGGVVVPPEDPLALADAIRKLATDEQLRRTLGQRGRDYVVASFDRAQLADRYLSLLQRVVQAA